MLIQKNRTIARQRRQISWLILFILLGITWVYSLKEDVYNLKSEKSILEKSIKDRELQITYLHIKFDSIIRTVEVVEVEPSVTKIKKIKKENIDTTKIVKRSDTLNIRKDSL